MKPAESGSIGTRMRIEANHFELRLAANPGFSYGLSEALADPADMHWYQYNVNFTPEKIMGPNQILVAEKGKKDRDDYKERRRLE